MVCPHLLLRYVFMYCVVPMGDDLVGLAEIMAMKVWKKSRRIGLVSLPDINMLKPPSEKYASRQEELPSDP